MRISSCLGVVATLGFMLTSCGETKSNTALLALSSPDSKGGALTATLLAGGPSVTRTLTLTNQGSCPATFTAAPEDTWLSVAPSTGTLAPTLALNLVVTIASRDASGSLPVGAFVGAVQISASCPTQATTFAPALVQVIVSIVDPDAGVGDGGVGLSDAGSMHPDGG